MAAEQRVARARDGIRYVDRESGELREERVFGRRLMELAYGNPVGRMVTAALLVRRPFSAVYGAYNDSSWSRRKIRRFIEELEIPLEEVDGRLEDFESFNAFFARRLRPQARPLDPDPSVLLSCADARTFAYQQIDADRLLPIKGAAIPIAGLLGPGFDAAPYRGGAAVIWRLCPSDYHRFHFPAAGMPGAPRSVPGLYHSVSPYALEQAIDVFCRNHRVVTELESEGFGRLALIDVGALCVGTIISTFTPQERVERGAEKGYFKFGGSTVVMLTEPGRVELDQDLVANTARGYETLVKFGQGVGRARPQREDQVRHGDPRR